MAGKFAETEAAAETETRAEEEEGEKEGEEEDREEAEEDEWPDSARREVLRLAISRSFMFMAVS